MARCKGPWPTITVGDLPSALAVDPAHHTLFAASLVDENGSPGSVAVVDIAHCHARDTTGCGGPLATIPVGTVPFGLHLDQATHTVYVANFDDNTVSVIDTAACNAAHPAGCPATAAPTFTVPDGPSDLDVNGRTHTAYVATVTGLYAFDTRTCNATTLAGCDDQGFVANCDDCFSPFSLRVDESTNTIYEPDGSNAIAAIDGRACNADNLAGCTSAPIGKVRLPGTFFSHLLYLAVDEALDSVYVIDQKDDTVVMVDGTICNGTHTAACESLEPEFVHTGTDPLGIALDAGTHTLYVANQLDDDVSVIDAAACSAGDRSGCRVLPPRIEVPHAHGVAVSQAVHTAYVTSDDHISMIDVRTCHLGRLAGCAGPHPTLADGEHPFAIAIDGSRHTAYVANIGSGASGSISVFDTHHCNAHPSGCAVIATMPLPHGVGSDVAVNSRTGRVYVAAADPQGEDTIARFDATTCNAMTTSGCHQQPSLMSMASGVGNCGDPSRMALAVDRASDTVYATHLPCDAPGDRIYVYAGAGRDPVATIPDPDNPFGLAVDEGTHTLYAALLAGGERLGAVAVVDLRTCNAGTTSRCDNAPATAPADFGTVGVAVDAASHHVYAVNDEDASVSVIRGRHCRAGRTTGCSRPPTFLPTDDYPTGTIALAPSVRTAYVSSATKGTVSLVPMQR